MSAELNRRIAELDGWRVMQKSGGWVLVAPDGTIVDQNHCNTLDSAWLRFSNAIPDFSGDSSAALALLAGVYWQAAKFASNEGDGIQVLVTGRIDAMHAPRVDYGWHANVLIVNGDEARAFAEAAALAWVSWKGAGDD